MGDMRGSKAGYDRSLGLIAKALRKESQNVAREPLPKRWIDLIHYLDEQERMLQAKAPAQGRPVKAH